VEEPAPRPRGALVRFARAAEARGLAIAHWAGRGDEERGLSLLALGLAAAYFVALFLPWFAHSESGWFLAQNSAIVALAVVLAEWLRLARSWTSQGSRLVAFCLVAGAFLLRLGAVVNLRWGGVSPPGFSSFQYGAWIGLVLAILLCAVAALQLTALRRTAQ
jgi:hypothetical protein